MAGYYSYLPAQMDSTGFLGLPMGWDYGLQPEWTIQPRDTINELWENWQYGQQSRGPHPSRRGQIQDIKIDTENGLVVVLYEANDGLIVIGLDKDTGAEKWRRVETFAYSGDTTRHTLVTSVLEGDTLSVFCTRSNNPMTSRSGSLSVIKLHVQTGEVLEYLNLPEHFVRGSSILNHQQTSNVSRAAYYHHADQFWSIAEDRWIAYYRICYFDKSTLEKLACDSIPMDFSRNSSPYSQWSIAGPVRLGNLDRFALTYPVSRADSLAHAVVAVRPADQAAMAEPYNSDYSLGGFGATTHLDQLGSDVVISAGLYQDDCGNYEVGYFKSDTTLSDGTFFNLSQNYGESTGTSVSLFYNKDTLLHFVRFKPDNTIYIYGSLNNQLPQLIGQLDPATDEVFSPVMRDAWRVSRDEIYLSFLVGIEAPRQDDPCKQAYSGYIPHLMRLDPTILDWSALNTTSTVDWSQETSNKTIVYPNPTVGRVTIGSKLLRDATVQIRNMQGQILDTYILSGVPQIDLADYPEGMYVISIDQQDAEGLVTVRVVKM